MYPRVLTSALALAVLLPSCASRSASSGAAVAQVGRGLGTRSQSVPQGAQACHMNEALTAPTPGAAEKADSATCSKAANSDLLWRRAMVVLAAYSSKLDALAAGAKPESAGQLEAALTGVKGSDWIEAEAGQEQSARDAVAKLVAQMEAKDDKADLAKTIGDAAPHIKTICSGLTSYLDKQATTFRDVRAELEKKRAAKTDRRCATFDNRTICVSESMLDRISYAGSTTGLATQEMNHLDARDDVASFCAAHGKLESAAAAGDIDKDETYTSIVDAVKGVPRAKPPRQAEAKPADEKPGTPAKPAK